MPGIVIAVARSVQTVLVFWLHETLTRVKKSCDALIGRPN